MKLSEQVYLTDISFNELFRLREFGADFDGSSIVDLTDAIEFVDALANAGVDITVDDLINPAPEVLLGDVNLDDAINFLDISPFIAVLSSGMFQAEADIDGNGTVNFLDISPFIAILSGS